MKLYQIIIISAISIIVFSCGHNNKANINKDTVGESATYYYSKRIVIFWCPTDKEYEKLLSSLSKEECLIFEDDLSYYNTMAMNYILNKNEEVVTDTNTFIGFTIGKDKLILNKKDFDNTLWKIVLFDAKSEPIIITPIEIVTNNEKYSYFFDNK